MNILIDTAVKGCNIVLFDDEAIIAMVHEPIERGYAEILLPLFQKLLGSCDKTPQDIDAIYTTIGPGSFTGLRVGLTTAQFMGFSLQKPVYGLTTFQAFSCGVKDPQNKFILIDTKRSDYYCQILDQNHIPMSEPQCLTTDHIMPLITENIMVTGDAVAKFIDETGVQGQTIQQDTIDIRSVVTAIQSGVLNFQKPEAFYIRDADVSKPKSTTR